MHWFYTTGIFNFNLFFFIFVFEEVNTLIMIGFVIGFSLYFGRTILKITEKRD